MSTSFRLLFVKSDGCEKKEGIAENDEFSIFSIPMILAVDEVAGKIRIRTKVP